MTTVYGSNRYKIQSTQLAHFGTYAKLHDMSAEDIVTGKTKKMYRVELSRGTAANHCRLVDHINAKGTVDPENDKLVYVDYKCDVYSDITEMLNNLGIKRNIKRRDVYSLIKLSYGYLMELSQNAFTYTENSNSEAQRNVRKADAKPRNNPFNLDSKTNELLLETANAMGQRLKKFEERVPHDPTAWLMDDWRTACLDRIKTALCQGRITDAMNNMMFAKYHGWDLSEMFDYPDDYVPKSQPPAITEADDRTVPYTFASVKDYCDYGGLYSVLIEALDQAAYGKGKERHANDLPFAEQKMQTICNAQGSSKGMTYQAIKKLLEAEGMDFQAKKRELLGAIVYTAGIIIWEEKQPIEE